MNSIFVIGGELIEMLDGSNDFALFRRRQTAKQHRYNSSMNRETKKALTSLEKSRSADTADGMFEHWKKTSFHPVSEFGKLTRRQQIYYVKNPHLLAVWGVGKQLEVIGMHYDYVIS